MKKKILFFARIDLSIPFYFGLKRKVEGQSDGMRALGYEVDLVNYCPDGLVLNQNEIIHRFKKNGAVSSRLNYYRDSYIKLPEAINFKDYDFLFIRYQMSNHFLVKMLAKVKKQNPYIKTIIEFPTFPFYAELISFGLKVNLIFELATRNRLKKYVDHVITYCGQDKIYGIPATTISNGIDASHLNLVKYNSDKSGPINMFCVANLTKFHAYDRIIKGMRTYFDAGNEKGVRFHIVGEGVQFESLKELTAELKLEDKVIFHGFKKGEELDKVYEFAHIGIGALGMHRKHLLMGSPLKIREYCAKGMPFVTASDTGFDKDFVGMVDVPSDESEINIKEVVDFCLNYDANNANMLRDYVIQNLNWKVQLKKVFDKFG